MRKMVVISQEIRECARPECDNSFTMIDLGKRFCSDRCRKMVTGNDARAEHTKNKTRKCKWCHKEFTGALYQILCPSCIKVRDNSETTFICIDGEGITANCRECVDCDLFDPMADDKKMCSCGHPKYGTIKDAETGHAHRYVLLGCGNEQIENPDGLTWQEIFSFLYDQFLTHHKRTVFAGFFLGYDFTQWLKTLPAERVGRLLLPTEIAKRKSKSANMNRTTLPVEHDGWQFDMLGERKMRLRPTCKCERYCCKCPKADFMHICDAGSFYQTSFLQVINPAKWKNKHCDACNSLKIACPQHSIVTLGEYELVKRGKEERETAGLDDDMRQYNRLENEILGRALKELDKGFRAIDINLAKDRWFGPGQPAANWLRGRVIRHKELEECVPDWALDAAKSSYFGGWFEIFMHGIVPGISWEYDINSAYPHIIASLPCLEHGKWQKVSPRQTELRTLKPGQLALVWATVEGSNPHIGAMMHRYDDRALPLPGTVGAYRIYRPHHTAGWFWQHEIEASIRAGLIDSVKVYHYRIYTPCNCNCPLWEVKNLYLKRLAVGKDTPQGKAAKLVYNSAYGKFAQSIGDNPPFNNWVYASLITAGCRTMILNAIASHPGKPCEQCKDRPGGPCHTAMVATDGVYFTEPHPGLKCSENLGEWSGGICTPEKCGRKHECGEKSNLTLFKPGFYWDDTTREALAKGDEPQFKSRGVSAKAFSEVIGQVDNDFQGWKGPIIELPGKRKVMFIHWPKAEFALGFNMVSARQALQWHRWDVAGHVTQGSAVQSSDPATKRDHGYYDAEFCAYRSKPYPGKETSSGYWETSLGYQSTMGVRSQEEAGERGMMGLTPDGNWGDQMASVMGLR